MMNSFRSIRAPEKTARKIGGRTPGLKRAMSTLAADKIVSSRRTLGLEKYPRFLGKDEKHIGEIVLFQKPLTGLK
jgi:hypothetical protein